MKKTPQPIFLKDYRPTSHVVESVDLTFDLFDSYCEVRSTLKLERNPHPEAAQPPLKLNGVDLDLRTIKLDGEVLGKGQYQLEAEHLLIPSTPKAFTLETVVHIQPQNNTKLEGLYRSSSMFCTQCEAEGFRKITFFPDRPDVMTRFTTTIIADQKAYPLLLSNGNLIASGNLERGRHWAKWEDPYKKPSYLFALVAGDLDCLQDEFITSSGRKVELKLFVEKGYLDQCAHAMHALKKSMKWDEDQYGREYDLDLYMVVAVSDFNMGAMENKGLNIFNTKYVLAKPETATDEDFAAIEEVISHEYFHNWTGNRVTCRDWFQLSLKEGLTVFRDQQFSADQISGSIKRIDDVNLLRNTQFREDAGPMAHPVRPESYIEMNNFYTVTIYNKGAEVVRMQHTLLGIEGFRKGMDLYFERHDGQAVTCDDFIQAMEDANGVDLRQFRLWYSQAGTPEVDVQANYDEQAHTYTLKFTQTCPPTPNQPHKQPFHIPIAVGLVQQDGTPLPLQLQGENDTAEQTKVLNLKSSEQSFTFVNVPAKPIPSLLRGFSAPVRLMHELNDDELTCLALYDQDPFNRWEANQQLAINNLLRMIDDVQENRPLSVDNNFLETWRFQLLNPHEDKALTCRLLSLPTETYLGELMEVIDVEAIHQVIGVMRKTVAEELKEDWLKTYQQNQGSEPYRYDPNLAGQRSLKNLCLRYLTCIGTDEWLNLAKTQYYAADNMTDAFAAVSSLVHTDCPQRNEVLEHFHQRWRNEPLVMDKWFRIQATSDLPHVYDEVLELMKHPAFSIKNPNKVRSLIGAFCIGNPFQFHRRDGLGYEFLGDQVLKLDMLNPQIASRLLQSLSRWRKYDSERSRLMKEQLERIVNIPSLSRDVYEIAYKSLS